MSLDDLNQLANERFIKIKSTHGWTTNKVAEMSRGRGIKIDEDKLQSMLDEAPRVSVVLDPKTDDLITLDSKTDEFSAVTTVTNFIDGLNLPPNLSLAIAYIIATNQQKHNQGEKFTLIDKVIRLMQDEKLR